MDRHFFKITLVSIYQSRQLSARIFSFFLIIFINFKVILALNWYLNLLVDIVEDNVKECKELRSREVCKYSKKNKKKLNVLCCTPPMASFRLLSQVFEPLNN